MALPWNCASTSRTGRCTDISANTMLCNCSIFLAVHGGWQYYRGQRTCRAYVIAHFRFYTALLFGVEDYALMHAKGRLAIFGQKSTCVCTIHAPGTVLCIYTIVQTCVTMCVYTSKQSCGNRPQSEQVCTHIHTERS